MRDCLSTLILSESVIIRAGQSHTLHKGCARTIGDNQVACYSGALLYDMPGVRNLQREYRSYARIRRHDGQLLHSDGPPTAVYEILGRARQRAVRWPGSARP